MAKLVKVTGYLVVDDNVDEYDIKIAARESLSSKFDAIGQPFTVDSLSLGENLFYSDEWNNHPLNSINCSIDTCESYFNKSNVGYVIVNKETGNYYNGMNQWKKDIRDAKIYHTEKGANETINYKFDSSITPILKKISINHI